MKNIRLLFLGFIIPFNLNFSFEVKSAEGTCADYKYKAKESKIEPTEKGLKIVTTAQKDTKTSQRRCILTFQSCILTFQGCILTFLGCILTLQGCILT